MGDLKLEAQIEESEAPLEKMQTTDLFNSDSDSEVETRKIRKIKR